MFPPTAPGPVLGVRFRGAGRDLRLGAPAPTSEADPTVRTDPAAGPRLPHHRRIAKPRSEAPCDASPEVVPLFVAFFACFFCGSPLFCTTPAKKEEKHSFFAGVLIPAKLAVGQKVRVTPK